MSSLKWRVDEKSVQDEEQSSQRVGPITFAVLMGNRYDDNKQDFLNLSARSKMQSSRLLPGPFPLRGVSCWSWRLLFRRHPHRLPIEWLRQPGGADSDDPDVATDGLAGRERVIMTELSISGRALYSAGLAAQFHFLAQLASERLRPSVRDTAGPATSP